MARKVVVQKPPTLKPERALRALAQQLEALRRLRGRRYDEADAEETEWTRYTQSIIEGAFGDPSSERTSFFSACHAGSHRIGGLYPEERQQNFEARQTEFEALLLALISALRLQLPEEEIKGVYEPGEELPSTGT